LSAFVGSGSAADPAAARALERALRSRGVQGRERGAFAEALQRMAAEYRVELSPEMTEITLSVLAEDAVAALELLAALLRTPAIGEEEVAAVRQQAERARLPSAGATGESGPVLYEGSLGMAVERFNALLFGEHPYGGQITPEQTRTLTAERVRAFHARHFVPQNVVLAVAGDIPRAEAEVALERSFAGWTGQAPPAARPAARVATRAPRRIHSYPAEKLQAWVVMGHELPPVPLADQAPLEVMNYILGGGHFDTRLFREVRDKRGLANTAGGFPEPGVRGPGSYTFRTYGRPEVVPFLIEIMLRDVKRIRSEPVSEEELRIAQGALADGAFPMMFEDGHATARTYAREWLQHRSHERTASYPQRIRSVTRRDVQAAARRYLHPERMQIVLVGPIEEVRTGSHPEGTMRLEDFGALVPGR
ncbi:MAG TPA: pitrilysin family protein, partial [Longimicrobiaceae bacterium]|nr:pitrilysin family protein [Longimicrobiaceae bacterium]